MKLDIIVIIILSAIAIGRTDMKNSAEGLKRLMKIRLPSMCPAKVEGKLQRAVPNEIFFLSSLAKYDARFSLKISIIPNPIKWTIG